MRRKQRFVSLQTFDNYQKKQSATSSSPPSSFLPHDEYSTTSSTSTTSTTPTDSSQSSTPLEDPSSPILTDTSQQIPDQLRTARNLVCIDIECHCFNQTTSQYFAQGRVHSKTRRICEIGIATFNTTSLSTHGSQDIQASNGVDRFSGLWHQDSRCIQGVNIGIEENRHDPALARCHYAGCSVGVADDFDFGPVLWCPHVRAVQTIVDAIHARINPLHPVTFLFFDDRNDIKWLSELGLDLSQEFPGHNIIDIQASSLSKAIGRRLHKPRIAAADYMAALGMHTVRTHNGGNDAMYELHGILAEWALTEQQRDDIVNGIRRCLPFLDRHGHPIVANCDENISGNSADVAAECIGLDSLEEFPALGT